MHFQNNNLATSLRNPEWQTVTSQNFFISPNVIKPAHCFFGLLSTKQFIPCAHSVFAWLTLVLIEALQLTPASFFKISNYGSSRCGYHQSNDLIFHHTFGAVLTSHNFRLRLGKLVLHGGLCQIHFSR